MQGSFYGWYMKCQSDKQTLAVIPAFHRTGRTCSCSIQIITDNNAWTISFPAKAFHRRGKFIAIGKNRFSNRGLHLDIQKPEVTITGSLRFGPLAPLKYHIMGPFALVPCMECCHMVGSMRHSVYGTVSINGEKYTFQNAAGYWEGDRGRSFPNQYLWTQCSFAGGSLMLSVADIPVAGIHFTGIIGFVLWQGKEYRLATYLGAKVAKLRNGRIRIVQGDMELEARLIKAFPQALKAPADGHMVRTIHESATCLAYYRFRKKNCTLFAFQTDMASFEYEFDEKR